jgi:RNA polymerase sigma factor (sigma-70 family)
VRSTDVNAQDREWLAQQFESNRAHLRTVAYRMLGSSSEADDAVQESWLRLSRSNASEVENMGGWLTTVVARVCLDMLRARKARREQPLDDHVPEPLVGHQDRIDPEHEALLADSVGPALLVVLETLAPAERLAFVLRDMFGVSFDEIAAIVGRSPAATRQLASRARRRVQGAGARDDSDRAGDDEPDVAWTQRMRDVDLSRQRSVVDAFLAAARAGDFDALVAVLDPDVVLRADRTAVLTGADEELRGAAAVARTFATRARAAQLAVVNGSIGLAWAPGGQPRVVFDVRIAGGRIVEIELLADPQRLGAMEVTLLDS